MTKTLLKNASKGSTKACEASTKTVTSTPVEQTTPSRENQVCEEPDSTFYKMVLAQLKKTEEGEKHEKLCACESMMLVIAFSLNINTRVKSLFNSFNSHVN